MSVERADIVFTRDKNGNIIYPVTVEDAVILRDGSYLSDKLDTLKAAENITGKVNSAIKEIETTLDEIETITEDTLVFDDELATSELEVHDVTELLNSIETKMQILYRLAIIADEDQEIGIYTEKTILEYINEILLQIEILSDELENFDLQYTGKEVVYDDINEYEPDGLIITGTYSEELIRLNNKLNDFKINYEVTIKKLYEDLVDHIFEDRENVITRYYKKEETYSKEEVDALIEQSLKDAIFNTDSFLEKAYYDKAEIDELLSHKAPLSHSHDNIYVNEGQDVPAGTVKFVDTEDLQSKYDENTLVSKDYLDDNFIGLMDEGMEGGDDTETISLSPSLFNIEEETVDVSQQPQVIPSFGTPVELGGYGQVLGILGDDVTSANRRFVKYFDYIKNDLGLSRVDLHCTRFGTLAMSSNNEKKSILNNIEYINADTDIILVMAGINDIIYNSKLGSKGDTSLDTVYGALDSLCTELLSKFPDQLIIFITPTNGRDYDTEKIAIAIKDVCEVYSIPVYDNRRLSGIYPKINGTTDGIHWNENTHKKVGKRLSKFIDTLIY